jgi:hypothetical protein
VQTESNLVNRRKITVFGKVMNFLKALLTAAIIDNVEGTVLHWAVSYWCCDVRT